MLFRELMETELDSELMPEVERLLDLKMNAPEIREIPRIDAINDYLDRSIRELKAAIATLPTEHQVPWEPLNDLFLQILECR